MRALTARQWQCLTLVALGLTNKQIAHEMAISERAVTAQVTRLLAYYEVPNRTSLIARVISDASAKSRAASGSASVDFAAFVLRDLDAYTAMPFFVTATLGREQVLVYANNFAKSLMAPGALDDLIGTRWYTRLTHPSMAAARAVGDEAFRRGVAQSWSSAPRWPRGDGSWHEGTSHCVIQPLREDHVVRGVMWICAVTEAHIGAPPSGVPEPRARGRKREDETRGDAPIPTEHGDEKGGPIRKGPA